MLIVCKKKLRDSNLYRNSVVVVFYFVICAVFRDNNSFYQLCSRCSAFQFHGKWRRAVHRAFCWLRVVAVGEMTIGKHKCSGQINTRRSSSPAAAVRGARNEGLESTLPSRASCPSTVFVFSPMLFSFYFQFPAIVLQL
jgi:hypothetical protein